MKAGLVVAKQKQKLNIVRLYCSVFAKVLYNPDFYFQTSALPFLSSAELLLKVRLHLITSAELLPKVRLHLITSAELSPKVRLHLLTSAELLPKVRLHLITSAELLPKVRLHLTTSAELLVTSMLSVVKPALGLINPACHFTLTGLYFRLRLLI